MISGAATNTITIPWMTEIMSIGMRETDCMLVAPLRSIPNNRDARTTPRGWLFPSNASAIASKPYPAEKPCSHPVVDAQHLNRTCKPSQCSRKRHDQHYVPFHTHARVFGGIRIGANRTNFEALVVLNNNQYTKTATANARKKPQLKRRGSGKKCGNSAVVQYWVLPDENLELS